MAWWAIRAIVLRFIGIDKGGRWIVEAIGTWCTAYATRTIFSDLPWMIITICLLTKIGILELMVLMIDTWSTKLILTFIALGPITTILHIHMGCWRSKTKQKKKENIQIESVFFVVNNFVMKSLCWVSRHLTFMCEKCIQHQLNKWIIGCVIKI